MIKGVTFWLALLLPAVLFGLESTKPPKPLTTLELGLKITSKVFTHSHVQVKGVCVWLTRRFPPKVITSPAISQFVPDLIVTVSNRPGENPWLEARHLVENKAALSGYQRVYQTARGFPLGFGNDSMQTNPSHLNEGHTRVVSVFGAPTHYLRLPVLTHKPETTFPSIYYSSLADAVMERSEVAELAYLATRPHLLLGHEIGTTLNHWGFEMPRLMYLTQPSRFRASVVAAMHAADIVTNQKSLHLSYPTTNRCGKDCIISNVTYDPKRKHVIWQEVYPRNRLIVPGKSDDFGLKDEAAGNGNYIFVVWRKYEGCVEQKGRLIAGVGMGRPHRR
ncbi:integrating conjugative element protein, PFL_4710 family [Legionella beliardensis]|uniref:Integrating conjugative element protein, PFL_4710 family n=1 Tax=Legionella beliardensis TaxID=91822 RepID=A0A378JQP8_9GAMM|nr:integrating conjugative element protein, PFL_4710 family [Legionella beliardensis]